MNLKKKPVDLFNKFIFFNLFNHFSNCLLHNGYKKKTFTLLLNLFLISKFKLKTNLSSVFIKGLHNVKPLFCFKVMYIGGKKYSVPIMQSEQKCLNLAVK
jgi:ribosomal protein S7